MSIWGEGNPKQLERYVIIIAQGHWENRKRNEKYFNLSLGQY